MCKFGMQCILGESRFWGNRPKVQLPWPEPCCASYVDWGEVPAADTLTGALAHVGESGPYGAAAAIQLLLWGPGREGWVFPGTSLIKA